MGYRPRRGFVELLYYIVNFSENKVWSISEGDSGVHHMHTIPITALCSLMLAGCVSSVDSLQQQAIDHAVALHERDIACRVAGNTSGTAAYGACLHGRLDSELSIVER